MRAIDAVIFDYGLTICSERYFNVPHPRVPQWLDIIQASVFGNETVSRDWMRGKMRLTDIAAIVGEQTGQDVASVAACLREGCRQLGENRAVIEFAKTLKLQAIPIALVTDNFDIFTEIVVPEHAYKELFDVIINSSDYGEIDQRTLWPLAFAALGDHIGYHNSLLIEDSENELRMFTEAGGQAIQYVDDASFTAQVETLAITRGDPV